MAVNQIEFVGSILVGCSTCFNFLLIHVAVPVNVNTDSVRGMGRIQTVSYTHLTLPTKLEV